MVSFRKSLMVVALLALCAGLAMAQTTNTTNVIVVRGEGVTEPLDMGGIVIDSTVPAPAGASGNVTGHYNITLYSLSTHITSNPGKNDGSTGDIVLYPCGATLGVPNCTGVIGIINPGSPYESVSFNNVPAVGVLANGAYSFVLNVRGIRVNASLLSVGGPVFTSGISFTFFVQPADTISPAAIFGTGNGGGTPIYTALNVAYAIQTLAFSAAPVKTSFSFLQCDTPGSDSVASPLATVPNFPTIFNVTYLELFSKSFLSNTDEVADGPSVTTGLGTRLSATFTGFPANTVLWVPTTIMGAKHLGATATMVIGANADGSGGAAATTSTGTVDGAARNWVAVTAGTPVIYQVTGDFPSSIEDLNIPVAVAFVKGSLPSLSAVTGTVTGNYAPMSSVPGPSATAPIPRFSSPAQTASGFYGIVACQTTLLFQYVTTASGWNTGLAISNTGATPSGDTGLGGTCSFSFYGAAGAPAAPVTLGLGGFGDSTAIASGTTAQGLASQAIGDGVDFTGYAFAVCDFTGGEGFAFPFAPELKGYISAGYLAKVVGIN